ncbi:MAG: GntR family transcriptional regulator [Rhodococcus erythropolis]|jgi:DNA-binding GntR family transcriptional regulator|nr:GntR family transcriptional regulator [Rhodococcus erythropolis]
MDMSQRVEVGLSTPDAIARAIRNDLIEGVLLAGTRVTEDTVCTTFSVGRHSARAAIQILVSQGLLVHERNRGAVVPFVTDARIDEMCSYRAVLEVGALKLALLRGTDWRAVDSAVCHLESLDVGAPWNEVIEVHASIHRAIARESHNSKLIDSHAASEAELTCMLAIIRPEYSATRLATMHRHLHEQLILGGEAAVRALEYDLEMGGRDAMHRALAKSRIS